MPEHDQPGEEDQGFTNPDLGAEDSDSESQGASDENGVEEEDEEKSPEESLRDYRGILAYEVRQITGFMELNQSLIEGEQAKPVDKQSKEKLETLGRQQRMWKQSIGLAQNNLDEVDRRLAGTQ